MGGGGEEGVGAVRSRRKETADIRVYIIYVDSK